MKSGFALAEMMRFYNSAIDKKDRIGLRKIFRHAGKIRTLYIDREILKKYSKCKAIVCKNIFNSRIEDEIIKFASIVEKKKDCVIHLKLSIVNKVLKIDRAETLRFITHQKSLVLRTIKKVLKDPSMLHKLRKRMKFFSYILQSLNKNVFGYIIETLDSFSSLIGTWNDLDENEKNSRLTLQKYPEASNLIQKTIDKTTTESGKLHSKILTELRSVQLVLKTSI